MENLIKDLRYSVRMLIKSPGFTAVALLALALGIGANTAIFSVVNAVLLRPLPFKNPDRLVVLWQDHTVRSGREKEWVSPDNFYDWRDRNQVFDNVSALVGWGPTLTGQGEPEDLIGAAVSHDMFSMLGVEPFLGRSFVAGEDRLGAEQVVVLSHRLWVRSFGSDPDIAGKRITLSGESYSVIGVMPAGFKMPFLPDAQLWRTLQPVFARGGCGRGCVVLRVVARLKPEATIDRARSEMSVLAAALSEQYPQANSGSGITVVDLHEQVVGEIKPALMVLLASVAFVLLIACANVANLLLARASAREKEIAIRSALGARRLRLIRQLLTESLLLSAIGGALGLLLAVWMVELLIATAPQGTPRLEGIGIDQSVLAFTVGVALLTGVLFGLAPALQTSKPDLTNSLKEGKGTGGTTRRRSMRSVLVVSEVALSLMLLIGAGLLMKSFVNLMRVDPGFNPEGVLTFDVTIPRTRYPERHQSATFFAQLVERLSGLPGVTAAGAITTLPLSGGGTDSDFLIEGQPEPQPGEETVAWYSSVTPDYFRSMGLRLVRGRFFTEQDRSDSTPVVLISEAMAKTYFAGEDPLAKRIGNPSSSGILWRQIVGIVGDVKHFGLDRAALPTMYLPHSQSPSRSMTFTVRTTADSTTLVPAVREQVSSLDTNVAVSGIQTMEEVLAESVAPRRFTLLLLTLFAALAVVLAAVGVYGVMAYSVTQRTHEIGLRMALGAGASDVLRMIVGQGAGLALIGVAIGLGGAYVLTRLMSDLLFNVSPTDPVTFVVIAVILTGIALVASFIPARRAMKVDPMEALRYE